MKTEKLILVTDTEKLTFARKAALAAYESVKDIPRNYDETLRLLAVLSALAKTAMEIQRGKSASEYIIAEKNCVSPEIIAQLIRETEVE
jgi:hypothetical protein